MNVERPSVTLAIACEQLEEALEVAASWQRQADDEKHQQSSVTDLYAYYQNQVDEERQRAARLVERITGARDTPIDWALQWGRARSEQLRAEEDLDPGWEEADT